MAGPDPGLEVTVPFDYQRYGQYYDYFLTTSPPGREPGPTFPGAGANVRLVSSGDRFATYENIGPLKPAPAPQR